LKDKKNTVSANDSLMGLVVAIVGIIYLILTISLPDATIGGANKPKIFPLIVAIILIVLGITFLFKSGISNIKVAADNFVKSAKKDKDTNILIGIACAASVLYALLFDTLGYVLSTFIFMEILLQLTNKNKWKTNTIVALALSVGIYIIFYKLLGVTLPTMIFLDI
jgi:putative tricarboxylic transport membrane protein